MVAVYTALVAAVEIYLLRDLRMSGSAMRLVGKALKNTTVMHSILGFVLSLLGRLPDQHSLRSLVGGAQTVGRLGQQHA